MQSNYVIWGQRAARGACSLDGMTGYADDWKLLYGHPMAGEFPATARFAMDPDYPRNVALTDSLFNIDMLLVASQALRALIEAQQPQAVEFLPVPIFNHKKREIKEPYTIVHPTHPVDCLVVDACGAHWDEINKKAIATVQALVIDEKRIPAGRLLFRPDHFCKVILAHRSLADKVDAANLTGMRWIELDNFPEV